MKFGKRLKHQVRETPPGWQDKYLSYKDLKKLIRLISLAPSIVNVSADSGRSEARFIFVLDNEIEKFNLFFMEQEEEFIIRDSTKILQWGPAGTSPSEPDYVEEMGRIRREIVDFHGEMVLLKNYSIINYTGLAKILKKYDKRTGGLLRRHVIQNVLEQPFFMTDLISRLVRECELTIDAVFPVAPVPDGGIPVGDDGVFRNTVAALSNMREIRRRSSTHSQFSLPPLDLP
uniref:SPX domain-containing protein n=1 Tax=Kalanchoe fedtschenkoi TaxID=63787 RepID=A0A7N0T0C6_KALFE